MIADMGAGARPCLKIEWVQGHAFIFYHSVKNDMGGDKKNPLPRMIADMGAGARPCLKIEHDLIEYALQIFLSAA